MVQLTSDDKKQNSHEYIALDLHKFFLCIKLYVITYVCQYCKVPFKFLCKTLLTSQKISNQHCNSTATREIVFVFFVKRKANTFRVVYMKFTIYFDPIIMSRELNLTLHTLKDTSRGHKTDYKVDIRWEICMEPTKKMFHIEKLRP